MFFNSPTDVAEKNIAARHALPARRAGQARHVERGEELTVRFDVTDGKSAIAGALSGHPAGSVPRRAGRGRRRRARSGGVFKADSVLAKHDENYMPKEVADALKKQGHWKDDGRAGEEEMIAETGHYALVLALALALDPGRACRSSARACATTR